MDGDAEEGFLFPVEDFSGPPEPVLVSACFLGVPCRWHGRRAAVRTELLERLKRRFAIVPVCPEQLGGMPTPRTSETLGGHSGADVLDGKARLVAPETGEDVTAFHVNGAKYVLEIARLIGAKRACLKAGSPSCDRHGVAGELLSRAGIKVVKVP